MGIETAPTVTGVAKKVAGNRKCGDGRLEGLVCAGYRALGQRTAPTAAGSTGSSGMRRCTNQCPDWFTTS